MSQSRIMDTLLIAADARADGRDAYAEAILQELDDEGAWAFEHWKSPPTVSDRIQEMLVDYYAGLFSGVDRDQFIVPLSGMVRTSGTPLTIANVIAARDALLEYSARSYGLPSGLAFDVDAAREALK